MHACCWCLEETSCIFLQPINRFNVSSFFQANSIVLYKVIPLLFLSEFLLKVWSSAELHRGRNICFNLCTYCIYFVDIASKIQRQSDLTILCIYLFLRLFSNISSGKVSYCFKELLWIFQIYSCFKVTSVAFKYFSPQDFFKEQ